MIELTYEIARQIDTEGERTYPDGCYGTLFGYLSAQSNSRATVIFPVVNVWKSEGQYHHSVIAADNALWAKRIALTEGVGVTGYYRSHPDHPAIPPEFDRKYTLPFYAYVIMAAVQRQTGTLTGWWLTQDRLHLLQEKMHIVS